MALSLAQLTAPLTPLQMRAQVLAGLAGLGVVIKTGTGTGSLALSGVPVAAYSAQVKIAASGEPGGAATYQLSLDGGVTWTTAATVPTTAYAIPGVGVSLSFAAGPAGAGTSFVAGDLFSFGLAFPNFPVTAWQPGSVPLTLADVDAQELADLSTLVAALALGGYVTTSPGVTGASGSWLDLIATNFYALTRNPAVATQGTITLTDAAGAGPFTITPGQLWIGDTPSLSTSVPYRYSNLQGGTLPQNGTLTLTVLAEQPGSAYNRAAGNLATLLTSLPGVTVTNPSNWITTQGADAESDLALATRCQGQWSALGKGATAATYDLWARTASSEVTRTKVVADGTTSGQVDIYLAGTAGAVSGGAVAAVQAYVATRLPLGVTQSTAAASNLAATIAGTVNVYTAQAAAAQAAVAANLAALIAATTIGGTLYLSQVVEALNTPAGVRNSTGVTINGSAADLVLTTAQVATLTNSLTFTPV